MICLSLQQNIPKVYRLIYCLPILLLLSYCGPNEEALLSEGISYLESSEYNKAISSFEKTLALNPKNTTAWNAKGISFFSLGKFDEAIEAFDASIELDPDSYKPYFNRGNALFAKEAYQEAIVDFNQANGLDPSIIDVYYNRGQALMALESYEDAIFDFEQAINLKPDYALAYFSKAKAELGNNDAVSGVASLFKVVELDQENGPAFYLLGVTQMTAFGQKRDGCANLNMALSLGYQDAKSWIDDFCKD